MTAKNTPCIRYCFTLNNPVDDQAPSALLSIAQYIIWQKEIAPDTGTPHLQGYVELKKANRISALIKIMQAHYTVCKGDQQSNIAYCTKPGGIAGPWELGEKKQENGKRKDLQIAIDIAKSGASKKALIESQPEVFLRYRSGLLDISATFAAQRTQQTHGIYVYGPPASGKTYFFKNLYKEAYWKDNSMWWHNYDGQDVVIWDEFEHTKYSIQDIKMILNHAPWNAPFKGGYASFTSKLVIFLSNSTIDEVYPECDIQHKTALLSRLRLFTMHNRKLELQQSPHWEKRFGLVHDLNLPDFQYNVPAVSRLMESTNELPTTSFTPPSSPREDPAMIDQITQDEQEEEARVFPSHHPKGESPNKFYKRSVHDSVDETIYTRNKPGEVYQRPIEDDNGYTGEPRSGFSKKRSYA